MSSAGIQKLFCGGYSAFKCSFDEFVGEKVFSPSYSSAILAPPNLSCFSYDPADVGNLISGSSAFSKTSLNIRKYSAIKTNTFESILMRWMKLEPIIQSEVSQKEKHQYSILTHIYGI